MKGKEYKVPYMVLQRGDLAFMNTVNLRISQSLTDEQMQEIANKLSNVLAQDWDELLKDMRMGAPELFEIKRKTKRSDWELNHTHEGFFLTLDIGTDCWGSPYYDDREALEDDFKEMAEQREFEVRE